jgi:hypothetical protein
MLDCCRAIERGDRAVEEDVMHRIQSLIIALFALVPLGIRRRLGLG